MMPPRIDNNPERRIPMNLTKLLLVASLLATFAVAADARPAHHRHAKHHHHHHHHHHGHR
jgi:Spy/CpxP family protein refolding chaperone